MSVIQKVIPSAKLSKQHSILFSVIPSRDAKTGKKVVTSDDEDEEITTAPSSSKKGDTREVCKYGEKCFRTNADHLEQYQHSSSKAKPKVIRSKSKLQEELASPTTTDNLLVKDKNKKRKFDDDK